MTIIVDFFDNSRIADNSNSFPLAIETPARRKVNRSEGIWTVGLEKGTAHQDVGN